MDAPVGVGEAVTVEAEAPAAPLPSARERAQAAGCSCRWVRVVGEAFARKPNPTCPLHSPAVPVEAEAEAGPGA